MSSLTIYIKQSFVREIGSASDISCWLALIGLGCWSIKLFFT